MYRLLCLLTLISFVEPYRNRERCLLRPYYPRHNFDEWTFYRLADDVIQADHKEKASCYRDQEISSKEVYREESYKFVTKLPNFNESTMEVKIKHRVLYIKAERDSENKKYESVKVLPQLLNVTAAEWSYSNQELTVVLPYKLGVKNETPLSCDNGTNVEVINVSKVELN